MKTWIKTNFYKITSILALFLPNTGLIVGSVAHHKTNDLQYYLDYDGNVHWGACTTIWSEKKMIFIKYIYIFQLIQHLKVM